VARPKTHDDTLRGRLLDQAGRLLSEQGPAALSLRKLASDVGTSTTAVYSLFGGKPQLMRELYREAFFRFGQRLSSSPRTGDPVSDLRQLGLTYRDSALADPHMYAVMFSRPIPGFEPDEQARAEAVELTQPLLDLVGEVAKSGLLVDEPVERVALGLWATVHGLVSLELNQNAPEGLVPEEHFAQVVDATFRGWLRFPEPS